MSKNDYTDLDAAILQVIGTKAPVTFEAIRPAVAKYSEPLASTTRENLTWRVVDRRLQALRKAGRIAYQRKPEGWVLKKEQGS